MHPTQRFTDSMKMVGLQNKMIPLAEDLGDAWGSDHKLECHRIITHDLLSQQNTSLCRILSVFIMYYLPSSCQVGGRVLSQ